MSNLRELGEKALQEGANITEQLRLHLGVKHNTSEVIEVAYDLQAGTYAEYADLHPEFGRLYAQQLARHLESHLLEGDVLLDAGTGELTTLSHVVAQLGVQLSTIHAFDISERRLEVGRRYAETHMGAAIEKLHLFKAELAAIPLGDRSVDVVTSNHALEPNGGREVELLSELIRVCRGKLVLFEPCYEIASPEGQARMKKLGYVQGLAETAAALGATVLSCEPLELVSNPLNPTVCLVVQPPR